MPVTCCGEASPVLLYAEMLRRVYGTKVIFHGRSGREWQLRINVRMYREGE